MVSYFCLRRGVPALLASASVAALVIAAPVRAQVDPQTGPNASQTTAPTPIAAGQASSSSPTKESKSKAGEQGDNTASTDIVVTARRKALDTAIAIKRNSDTIVDAVVADAAGQLPDNSITEVLQRVPGVTISRFVAANGGNTNFQAEGTGLAVRGLPYTSSTLNGEQVFSANGGSSISWGEVTPELMAAVDVYKASRADMIEGGASSIDLRTHMPFDFNKTQFDVTAGGSYGDLSKKASPSISALYSRRVDSGIGEIGILWDFAFNRLYQQSSDMQNGAMFGEYAPTAPTPDNIGLIPSGFNWSTTQNKRDRYGAYQAIQWKPSSNLTITNTVFFSEYVADSYEQGGNFGLSPNSSSELIPSSGNQPYYDSNGGLRAGTLVLGSTGNAAFGTNTTAASLEPDSWKSWFPTNALNISCGGTYGDPVSSLNWNWGLYGTEASDPTADNSFISCTNPTSALNPTGYSNQSYSKNSTLNISQSFVWTPGNNLEVRGGGQYVLSHANSKNMYLGLTQGSTEVTSATVNMTGSIPTLTGLNTNGMLDPTTAYLASMGYNGNKNKGEMLAGHLDADYKLSDDGFFRTISAGVRVSSRTEDDDFIGTYYAPLGQSWLGAIPGVDNTGTPYAGSEQAPNPADYQITDFPNFFGGRVAAPNSMLIPSQSLMQSMNWCYLLQKYNGQIPNGTCAQYWSADIDQGLGITHSHIFNAAAYVETKFEHDAIGIIPRFSGNIGIRVFHDTLRASGILSEPASTSDFVLSAADSTLAASLSAPGGAGVGSANYPTLYSLASGQTVQTRNYEYTRFLPSANIKFDLSPKLILRGAASESSAPPNLGDIRAGGSISPILLSQANPLAPPVLTGVQVNAGGAKLKPVMIRSEDLSFEYYPNSRSQFHLDLFAKQIKDQDLFYSYTSFNLPIPATALANGSPANASATTLNVPWLYLQNKTSSAMATMKGFEVGGSTFFDHLPGLLKGFGIDANLTFVDSHSPAQQANNVLSPMTPYGGLNADGTVPQTYPNLPYPGLSKWSYNVQLLYSLGKLNVRLAYNWRDKALLSTNVNPLSYATSGGNPYILNTSPTDFSSTASYPVYNMVPAWTAAAGYLDFGIDYKINEHVLVTLHASNLLNTLSKTLQEPLPGVFEPYDTNVSDRRFDMSVRLKF